MSKTYSKDFHFFACIRSIKEHIERTSIKKISLKLYCNAYMSQMQFFLGGGGGGGGGVEGVVVVF